MKKALIFSGIALILVIVIAAITIGPGNESDVNGQNPGESAEAVWVEVYAVESSDIVLAVSETGVSVPIQNVTIASEVSGRIERMDIKVGSPVKSGEIIAETDDELIRLSLDQARAQLINSTANFDKAQKDLERYKVLLQKEEISESEYESFLLQYEQARSAFLSAEAAAKSAERQLRNTRISSPIDGEIAVKYVEQGNMITVNQPVVKVVDISTVKIVINLSEQDVVKVKAGTPVDVTVDAFRDHTFTGSVYSISPEADNTTHTFPVEISVPNDQDPVIRSGMIARVNIRTGTLSDVVLIPRDAIIERYGRNFIFVVREDRAVERQVELGSGSDSMVQVISGVQAGDEIVSIGQLNLTDGAKIQIRNE
ncbi:efflux RND transporter periplasmic adaptor subunit [candidate division KSB1 bacterium]